MGRARGGLAAVAAPRRGMNASAPPRRAREETVVEPVRVSVRSLTSDPREQVVNEELKRRFGEWVDLNSAEHISASLDLMVEAMSDNSYDFGLSRSDRTELRSLLTELRAVNESVEELSGIAERERLQATAEEREPALRRQLSRALDRTADLYDQRPKRSELWEMTWRDPIRRMRETLGRRRDGELSATDCAKGLAKEMGRGTMQTFGLFWQLTGKARGVSAAVKVGLGTTAALGMSDTLTSSQAAYSGLAAAAVVFVGAGVWAEAARRRHRRRRELREDG